MTPKEALKNILDYVNLDEYDYETKGIRNAEMLLKQALTELERLKKFKETFDNYELVKRRYFIVFENWLECERELAVIKCDVKRYFELYEQAREKWGNGIDDKEAIEYTKLHLKLLEVGKEE